MIVVTGAAGFIGSCLVQRLNEAGYDRLVLVDDFSKEAKAPNLEGKKFENKIERKVFFDWLAEFGQDVDMIYHLGARTDTTEFDKKIFDELNLNYSKKVWKACVKHGINLVYASSAATYGMGDFGYKDDHQVIDKLVPLNPYGDSKNDFDKWVLDQDDQPLFWAGLKFFNVYGPNEYHKGRMASVIFHAYNQIKKTQGMKLFRSHNPSYKDGEQLRDFIYVKDVVEVCLFLKEEEPENGIYNLGSGTARTFVDLTKNTFKAMNVEENISFIDTPLDIRDKYQYYTKADMNKLLDAGYDAGFHTLEEGVADYVSNYLSQGKYY